MTTTANLQAAGSPADLRFDPVPVQLSAAAADNPAKVDLVVYTGGPMVLDPWGPTVVDLLGMTMDRAVVMLRDHDAGRIVGHITRMTIGAANIVAQGVISGAGSDALVNIDDIPMSDAEVVVAQAVRLRWGRCSACVHLVPAIAPRTHPPRPGHPRGCTQRPVDPSDDDREHACIFFDGREAHESQHEDP